MVSMDPLDTLILDTFERMNEAKVQMERDKTVYDAFMEREQVLQETKWFYLTNYDAPECSNYAGKFRLMIFGDPIYDNTGSRGRYEKLKSRMEKLEKFAVIHRENVNRSDRLKTPEYEDYVKTELHHFINKLE
jgi:hypothetical protein